MTDEQNQLKADYKAAPAPTRVPVRRRYWLLLALTLALAGTFELVAPPPANAGRSARLGDVPVALAATPVTTPAPVAAPALLKTHLDVHSGDSLAQLFSDHGLNATDLHDIMDSGAGTDRLRHILPGDTINIVYTPDGHIDQIHMAYDDAHTLDVTRDGDGFHSALHDIPTTTTVAYAQGTIENSLFDAATRAGLTDATTMALIQLFSWDIDFAHDIQNGDRFTVLYQQIHREGHPEVDGPILAASFVNQDKTYTVLRYTDPDGHTGYYTPDGRSIRKALMRAPVAYSRISSGFSLHRKHPILGFTRAHQGVDYAAPIGTPVKAAGDGRIVFMGTKGGYGKCIVIDHGGGYSTLYGHLSRFRRGFHTGSHVAQDQTIAYVGMTGLATGPHLHFEVRVGGVPRNPRTVSLPSAAPVPLKDATDFDSTARMLLAQLSSNGEQLAGAPAKTSDTQAVAH